MRTFFVRKEEIVRVSLGPKALADAQVQQRPSQFIDLGDHYMVSFSTDGEDLDRLAAMGVLEVRGDEPLDKETLAAVVNGKLAVNLEGKTSEEAVNELLLAGMAKQSLSVYNKEQRTAVLAKMQDQATLEAAANLGAGAIKAP